MHDEILFVNLLFDWLCASLVQGADSSRPAGRKAEAATPGQASFSGKVVETMNAATYTYVQVDTGTKKIWAAAPQFAVKVGDSVVIAEGMEMRNYPSKTLNRTFDVVYFTGSVQVNGQQPAAAPGVAELPKNHPPIGGASAKSAKDFSSIRKAQGGKSIEEVYSGKANLSGKQTTVRGKVVKFNANIMGKNWIHIQDGTGAVGSNDLLVTSATEVKVGATVLVTGVVAVNKDFGANYKYAVMIEDAKVVVE